MFFNIYGATASAADPPGDAPRGFSQYWEVLFLFVWGEEKEKEEGEGGVLSPETDRRENGGRCERESCIFLSGRVSRGAKQCIFSSGSVSRGAQ